MKKRIICLALITITALGCNTTKTTGETTENVNTDGLDQESIIQEKWTLIKLEGQDVSNIEGNSTNIYFTLKQGENRLNGFAGCNTFMGNYKLEQGNRINFSKIATTRMACPNAAIDEAEVLKVFELANNYTINGDTLMLNIGKRAPLAVFIKSAPQITENYWKLKTLEGQKIEMAANQEKEIYFMLKTEGNGIKGFAGCNDFSGIFNLEKGNRIRFSQMATTLKACPDIDVNEPKFLKVFELADNYTLNGDTLTLNVGRRVPLAVFEAIYFE